MYLFFTGSWKLMNWLSECIINEGMKSGFYLVFIVHDTKDKKTGLYQEKTAPKTNLLLQVQIFYISYF